MQQRGILDDEGIRFHDRFAQTNFPVRDAAKRHHRRAHALRTETGEGLGIASFGKGRSREYLCRRHDALPPSTMYAQLKHIRFPLLAQMS